MLGDFFDRMTCPKYLKCANYNKPDNEAVIVK